MPPTNNDEISAAWRALSGSAAGDGWRSIAISGLDGNRLLAARHFPGNCEALLIGFESVVLPPTALLPEGSGFKVERVSSDRPGSWMALSRQSQGSLELFARMAADVVATLAANRGAAEQRLFQLFVGRIRAWQQFMNRTPDGLGPSAEVGLHGELSCLDALIAAGVTMHAAVEGWKGPLDGLQDFELGSGAIEVKSTLAHAGFPATIMSLEQLDDAALQPLFLCACKFTLSPEGLTLPDRVGRLRTILAVDTAALALFETALLHAGFLDAHADHYPRQMESIAPRFMLVDEKFPRLTPGNVPPGIRQARYEIDLETVGGPDFPINNVIELIGVVAHGAD